jgi:hypothetical protein
VEDLKQLTEGKMKEIVMNEGGLSLNGHAKIQIQGATFIMNPKPDILDHTCKSL